MLHIGLQKQCRVDRATFLMVRKFCTVTELLHPINFSCNKIVTICNILQNNFIISVQKLLKFE